jgi:cytokinin riboside 5'-monophosphate phosphoribohydrolase
MENICVFGAGSRNADPIYYEEAHALGALIAQNGYGLVFGGGNSGLMGQVARGAQECGAPAIIGIAPEFMNYKGVLFEACTELILTVTMHERKQAMESLADAFVVLPGGVGTFEEFFEVFTHKTLGLHKKAIVLMNTKGFFDSTVQMIRDASAKLFIPEEALGAIEVVAGPRQVIACLDTYEYTDIGPKWLGYKED